jgi:hypothetical protein
VFCKEHAALLDGITLDENDDAKENDYWYRSKLVSADENHQAYCGLMLHSSFFSILCTSFSAFVHVCCRFSSASCILASKAISTHAHAELLVMTFFGTTIKQTSKLTCLVICP